MNRRKTIVATVCCILFLFFVVWAYAAGTLSITQSTSRGAFVRKINFNWTSDASGNVNSILSGPMNGKIVGVVFDPGTPAPTALYDVVMLDTNGFDVLSGQGANLSATVTTQIAPGIGFKDGTTTSIAPIYVAGTLTLQVTNAGNATQGVVSLIMLPQ